MPFENFNNRHFSEQEKTMIENTLTQLETAFAGKLANLTQEERKQFGSVNEQNKLIINKVKQLADTQADLKCPDIDWQEFDADYHSRDFLDGMVGRIDRLYNGLTSAKILHDYDNYKDALKDYEYAKFKNGMEAPGYAVKVKELRQFFPAGNTNRRNDGNTEDNNEDAE